MATMALLAIIPEIGTIWLGTKAIAPANTSRTMVTPVAAVIANRLMAKAWGMPWARPRAFHAALSTMMATISSVSQCWFTLMMYVSTYPTTVS